VGHRNSDKIDVEDFKFFKRVFSAHIHIRQVNRNFEFIGSNFQMDRNDYGDQKGITVLDTNTGETEFIPNNISPVFKKVRITNEGDIEILEKLKDSKDYIDIAISNNLLISNRKLRRKLEVILEKSNFASVEYIDDITKELIDDESNESIEINEETLDISIALEYEDYVKEYILKQKYDSDKFKSGVISEYDEVIKIYKENYNNQND
jgi:DNA repair exonuclease SbcCD nuclease subunit